MKKLVFIGIILTAQLSFAQQENTLHFMQSISQSRYNNPAFIPNYKLTIGLPGLSSNYISYANSGFALNHLIKKRIEDDSLQLMLNDFYNRLNDKNYLNLTASTDLFHLGFKVNPRIHFLFNVSAKSYNRLMYPKDLAALLIEGNAPLLNEKMTLSPAVESIGYIESGFGASYVIDRYWTVGAKVKILKGFFNVTTQSTQFDITTNDDYHITINGKSLINTSGFDQVDNLEVNNFSDVKEMIANNGIAFDLGATFKPVDKVSVGLSLVDIGGINWKHDVKSYELDQDSASFTFKGFDVVDLIEGNNDSFDDVVDSLTNRLEYQESTGGSYRSPLPKKIYLSGTYEISRNLNAGLLLFGEIFRGRLNTALAANITKDIGRRMSFSLNYSAMQRSYDNLGAGISFNLAPVQLYFVSDNCLGAPIALISQQELNPYLKRIQTVNLRFGLNLVFGWDKTEGKISQDPHY